MATLTAILIFILGIVAASFSNQLSDEFKAWTPRILRRLVTRAVRRRPECQRHRFAEEWAAHVDEVPGEIGKICVAVGFHWAAYRMRRTLGGPARTAEPKQITARGFSVSPPSQAFGVAKTVYMDFPRPRKLSPRTGRPVPRCY